MASNDHNIKIQIGAHRILNMISRSVNFKQKIEFGNTHVCLIKVIEKYEMITFV